MPRQPVVVLLIAYRASLSAAEKVSIKQCLKVLGAHPIVVIAPEGLELPRLLSRLPSERFPAACFASVRGYNRLVLSPQFYDRFDSYEYLLIHQLDAFVFRDELLAWCARGFDYVGAPWIGMELPEKPEWRQLLDGLALPGRFEDLKGKMTVGNGGFSLRRVETFSRVLATRKDLLRLWGDRHEDGFWGIAARLCLSDKKFRVPSEDDALQFAFETEPQACYRRLGRLPFGCHAWSQLAPDFWRPWIRKAGWKIHVPGDGGWQDRLAAFIRGKPRVTDD